MSDKQNFYCIMRILDSPLMTPRVREWLEDRAEYYFNKINRL